jgi:Rap1a immunity proteins
MPLKNAIVQLLQRGLQMKHGKLAAAIVAAHLIAAPAYAGTAAQLIERCTDGNPSGEAFCMGFVLAVSDMLHEICPPKGITNGQFKAIFLGWAQAHPDIVLKFTDWATVSFALIDTFPCPKTAATPQVSRIPAYRAPDQLIR